MQLMDNDECDEVFPIGYLSLLPLHTLCIEKKRTVLLMRSELFFAGRS